jgi:hypothetical protein
VQLFPLIQIDSSTQSRRDPTVACNPENSFSAAFELLSDAKNGSSVDTPVTVEDGDGPGLDTDIPHDSDVLESSEPGASEAPDDTATTNPEPEDPPEMTGSPAIEGQPTHRHKPQNGQEPVHISAAQLSLGVQMVVDIGAMAPVAASAPPLRTRPPAQAGAPLESDVPLPPTAPAKAAEVRAKSAATLAPPVSDQNSRHSAGGVSVAAVTSDNGRATLVPVEGRSVQGAPQSLPSAMSQVVTTTKSGVARSPSPTVKSGVWPVPAQTPTTSSPKPKQNAAAFPALAPARDSATTNPPDRIAASPEPTAIFRRTHADEHASGASTTPRGSAPDAARSDAPPMTFANPSAMLPEPEQNATALPTQESAGDRATAEPRSRFSARPEPTAIFRRAQANGHKPDAAALLQSNRSDAPAQTPALTHAPAAKPLVVEMAGTYPSAPPPLVTASQALAQEATTANSPPTQAAQSASSAVTPPFEVTISSQSQAVPRLLSEQSAALGDKTVNISATALTAKMPSEQMPSADTRSQTSRPVTDPPVPASDAVAQRPSGADRLIALTSNPRKSFGVLASFDTGSVPQTGSRAGTLTGLESAPPHTVDTAASPVRNTVSQSPTDKAPPLSLETLPSKGSIDPVFSQSEPDSFMVESRTTSVSPAASHIAPTIASSQHLHTTVARQIADALKNGADRPIELTLSPSELGRVRMSLSATDTGVSLVIHADRPETLDLMRRNITELDREFVDMGYAEISFSFSGGDGAEDHRDERRPDQSDQAVIDIPTVTPPPETHQNVALSPSSAMDIRI